LWNNLKKPRQFINSLGKGLSILNTFSTQRPELTLTDLARANGMTLGTAHRYLFTLKELDYLTQSSEDKKYRLTKKVLSLGFSVFGSMDFRKRLFPYMVQITKEMDVVTQCAILDGIEIVYIERLRSNDVVNLDLNTGSRLPAYCTAMGKAIMAFIDEKESKRLINRMKFVQHTPYTITNKKNLWKELQLTRKRGFAINNQELTLGLRSIAAPIFNREGVEGAFGVSYRIHRIKGNNLENVLVEKLLEISKKVSIEL